MMQKLGVIIVLTLSTVAGCGSDSSTLVVREYDVGWLLTTIPVPETVEGPDQRAWGRDSVLFFLDCEAFAQALRATVGSARDWNEGSWTCTSPSVLRVTQTEDIHKRIAAFMLTLEKIRAGEQRASRLVLGAR